MITFLRASTDHLIDITDIYNQAVLTTTATFDSEPISLDEQRLWFAEHNDKFPIFIAEKSGKVIGWASLSKWSGRCAYSDTAEISIYIKDGYRGKGVGTKLMMKVLEEGKKAGIHTVLARISEGSEASIRLHKNAGFEYVGVMREVGKKFGKLLDIHLLQLVFK
ncbi:MAG: GNAT family N-acetyltransferase [Ignavibacteria bacterium RBG_16_34_14]|nr:MAG: GNAT family N-acetyltransferase [Ignavibacteria bacterium RBG_16_34_14]